MTIFIKLNADIEEAVANQEYTLDPTIKYEIKFMDEIESQVAILVAIQTFGLEAMKDYHNWLIKNGFNAELPNPTNEFVSKFYGKEPLWKTKLSQGIVVFDKFVGDYYIVLECSRENVGFKHTQIIVTPGGCL